MMAAAGGDGPSGYIVGVENAFSTTNNLFVVDISDNTSPSVVGNLQYGFFRQATCIAAYPSQERVYVVGQYDRRISCVNMTDPTNPTFAGSFQTASGWNPVKIGITGDVLLVYEHKSGDTDGRLTSYDLTASLTAPTQIDQVSGTDYYKMQSAFFDNTNGALWMATTADVVMVWDYSDTSNLGHGAYKISSTLLDGPEAIAAVGDKAVAVESADGKFAECTFSSASSSITVTNTGNPGKSDNSNGQGIRLSDGYCYYALNNFSTGTGFIMPTAQISDAEVVSGLGSITISGMSDAFPASCLATDNTENYLYVLSSDGTSSKLLVLDVSGRTTATTVSNTTLTGYGVNGANANMICHYDP